MSDCTGNTCPPVPHPANHIRIPIGCHNNKIAISSRLSIQIVLYLSSIFYTYVIHTLTQKS